MRNSFFLQTNNHRRYVQERYQNKHTPLEHQVACPSKDTTR
ncbi:hypothetical protein [Photorhabdus akhurstii]